MKDRLNLLIKFGSLAVAAALTLIGCILLYTGYIDSIGAEGINTLGGMNQSVAGLGCFALALIALKAGEIIRE